MPHPIFHASISKMSGGGSKLVKNSSKGSTFFTMLLLSLISLSISGIIVQWAYNEIMPSIYASYSDKPFVPLSWRDSIILVLLTHALIW